MRRAVSEKGGRFVLRRRRRGRFLATIASQHGRSTNTLDERFVSAAGGNRIAGSSHHRGGPRSATDEGRKEGGGATTPRRPALHRDQEPQKQQQLRRPQPRASERREHPNRRGEADGPVGVLPVPVGSRVLHRDPEVVVTHLAPRVDPAGADELPVPAHGFPAAPSSRRRAHDEHPGRRDGAVHPRVPVEIERRRAGVRPVVVVRPVREVREERPVVREGREGSVPAVSALAVEEDLVAVRTQLKVLAGVHVGAVHVDVGPVHPVVVPQEGVVAHPEGEAGGKTPVGGGRDADDPVAVHRVRDEGFVVLAPGPVGEVQIEARGDVLPPEEGDLAVPLSPRREVVALGVDPGRPGVDVEKVEVPDLELVAVVFRWIHLVVVVVAVVVVVREIVSPLLSNGNRH
mmetsp:Transcript_26344/g.61900  ORF Transcript_26344/g.61900 Transcript_26344/m.61900 type:complete len:402 (+) Transcript_26344:248-1453(+)|eukprot:CAMPEP_0197186662 /NCGR_PEP_ID=MMETSP1423-20130617/14362_1 /TAXON_ID=476441 /ORGANISM="Pseudo-nitzschia heimii, Strain UNC1101" /LENGTH=401 /DNA_ID=CAMNT_0042638047 /DNA_START=187 /DNA_END=1392 /DNA_ORIENTATION=-